MKRAIQTVLLGASFALSACGSIPLSVRTYAAGLPARADGQYALLDEPLRKQLVLNDAGLQCAIDAADDKNENSVACKCASSQSDDWLADCTPWLGTHAPQPEPAAAQAPSS